MNRAAHRKKRSKQANPASKPPHESPAPSGGQRRLIVLLGLGVVLVCVAGYVRYRAVSNPQLRIPPVETQDVLPTVAKEIRLRQEDILADPQSAEAWGMYGLVLLAHDFRDQAATCFAEAENLANDDYRWPYYYGMTMGASDTEQSRRAFQRAVEKEPNRVAIRMRLAEWLFDLRQLEASERHTREALKQEPDSPRAQLLIARLRFQEGNMEESYLWAQRAADSPQGKRRDVHELLARLHTRLGNSTAAAEEVARAEMLPRGVAVWDDPEMGIGGMMMRDATFLNTLATIHLARGNTKQWLKLLEQIVDAEPENIQAKERLAQALIASEEFTRAQRIIDKTLSEYPEFSQFECLRGQVDMAAGNAELARKRFERARHLKPDYADAFMWWGRSLIALERFEEAITALQEAVRLSPSMATAYDDLGRALLADGQHSEAVNEFQRASNLKPGDLTIRLHLAEALVAANRHDQAIQALQAIVRAGEAPQKAIHLLKQLNEQQPAAKVAPEGGSTTQVK